jgi:hypothetical protein
MIERLPEIALGRLLRKVGPKQASKRLSPVRPFRFDNQVNQQCPNLVGAKSG